MNWENDGVGQWSVTHRRREVSWKLDSHCWFKVLSFMISIETLLFINYQKNHLLSIYSVPRRAEHFTCINHFSPHNTLPGKYSYPKFTCSKVKLRNTVYIACYLPRITQLVTDSAMFKPRVNYMKFMLLRKTWLKDPGVTNKIEHIPTPSSYSGKPE